MLFIVVPLLIFLFEIFVYFEHLNKSIHKMYKVLDSRQTQSRTLLEIVTEYFSFIVDFV